MSFKATNPPPFDDIIIQARSLTKIFPIYARPIDRLKQAIFPSLRSFFGLAQKNYCTTFTALDDVSFEIRRGETVGILGHNGAGKSTLLQLLCGTLSPTSGEMIVKGRVAALLELGAGFNGEYTGRENVYMNAHILGLNHEEIDARFDDIAKFADIGDFIERQVKSYSSGMYARLAFAVAICVDPDILIIDEALAVGDARFQKKCFDRLREMKKLGTTILFVSHAIEQVRLICDFGLVLNKGKKFFFGAARDATIQYFTLVHGLGNRSEVSSRPDELTAILIHPPGLPSDWRFPPPNKADKLSFGIGGAWLNRYKFSGISAPNIINAGKPFQITCDYAWDISFIKNLIDADQYESDISIGIALSAANGVYLFGCNGFDAGLKTNCLEQSNSTVEFSLDLPQLTAGDYFLTLTIALGSLEKHVQLFWHDSLFQFKMIEGDKKVFGVLAVDYTLRESVI